MSFWLKILKAKQPFLAKIHLWDKKYNMRKLLSLLFILWILGGVSVGFAQNNTETSPFEEVRIFGCLSVELSQDDKESVIIENINGRINKEDIKISVSGKTLKVSLRYEGLFSENNCEYSYAHIKISYKVLQEIQTGGGADVKISSPIQGKKFVAEAYTGSSLKLQVEVEQIWLEAKTGADLNISGKAESQDSVVNTGGTLRAYNLICKDVSIRANTGGTARISVTSFLEASASMGGDISFKGTPERQEISTSFGGDVNQSSSKVN
jgi:hypothetical protein